ncbi:MAG: class I SAM-dependent methyltransferase [Chloroflexi bacterium]|nr:class I SAM-dependent methyltransferase [Chloroflexota bacterium]MCY3695966.1 class I SAM-dependent methyltransferase [Chloroflexota bacterium]
MQLIELSRRLKSAYLREGGVVPRRLRHLEGWMDRAGVTDDAASYDHTETVKDYYDLCNEFMVFGWGESLHFAPLSPDERLEDSQIRHQRLMIERLDLQAGMNVIDVGCGVGGPMRRVVREAGVRVTGVNINEIQLERARSLGAEAGIDEMADYLCASFMDMSAIPDATFDRGYAIESTCHAPDKEGAFAEINRVLKPGALFWGQEMCMTDRFAPGDPRHQEIKRELQQGIALKEIATTGEVDRALEAAGFEVVEGQDLGIVQQGASMPWYQPVEWYAGARGGILNRLLGRRVFIGGTRIAELLRIFPEGSTDVIRMMDRTAQAYIAGGQTGIFTPLYCFLARKPYNTAR